MISNIKLLISLVVVGLVLGTLMYLTFNKKSKKYIRNYILMIIIGVILIVLGISLNFKVVNKNNGKMPISTKKGAIVEDYRHEEVNNSTTYKALADNVYLIFPCKGMYSIGDIIGSVGFIMAFATASNIVLLAIKEKI